MLLVAMLFVYHGWRLPVLGVANDPHGWRMSNVALQLFRLVAEAALTATGSRIRSVNQRVEFEQASYGFKDRGS